MIRNKIILYIVWQRLLLAMTAQLKVAPFKYVMLVS